MNETKLIEAKKWSVKGVCILICIIGLIIGFILVFTSTEYSWHSGADYFWFSIVPTYLSISFLPLLLLAVLLYFMVAKTEMTITNKRVYGKAIFGKRVDLPVDSISAVGTSMLKGIAVSTSSGKIKFLGINNRDEIHKVLSDLIIERQEKPVMNTIRQEVKQSDAEEIKRFKELYDQGIISQNEFEAKKKQLLGL